MVRAVMHVVNPYDSRITDSRSKGHSTHRDTRCQCVGTVHGVHWSHRRAVPWKRGHVPSQKGSGSLSEEPAMAATHPVVSVPKTAVPLR